MEHNYETEGCNELLREGSCNELAVPAVLVPTIYLEPVEEGGEEAGGAEGGEAYAVA